MQCVIMPVGSAGQAEYADAHDTPRLLGWRGKLAAEAVTTYFVSMCTGRDGFPASEFPVCNAAVSVLYI